jgi:hypothetical protein
VDTLEQVLVFILGPGASMSVRTGFFKSTRGGSSIATAAGAFARVQAAPEVRGTVNDATALT